MDDHLLASASAVELRLGLQHPLATGSPAPRETRLAECPDRAARRWDVRVELPSGKPPLATQFDADKLPRSEFCGDVLRGDAEKLCGGISADTFRQLLSLGELVTQVGEDSCHRGHRIRGGTPEMLVEIIGRPVAAAASNRASSDWSASFTTAATASRNSVVSAGACGRIDRNDGVTRRPGHLRACRARVSRRKASVPEEPAHQSH